MLFTSPSLSALLQEERVVNHMAAKIIENVCTTCSAQAQGFVTGEIGPALWYLFRHSTVDSLRITAVSVRWSFFWGYVRIYLNTKLAKVM